MFPWAESVRGKMMLVILATTFVALLFAALAMVVYETQSYRRSVIADLTTQADILARANAPALVFNDPKAANENLAVMRAHPGILSVALYAETGELFASYRTSDAQTPGPPSAGAPNSVRISGSEIVVSRPVIENQELVGTVHLRARYALRERLEDFLAIIAAVLAAGLGVALLVSAVLQAAITKPILAVTDVAHKVMENRDFSLRVERTSNDELGYLVDAFNAMLAEVGKRATDLETSNRSLEIEMLERRGAEDALRAADRRKDEFLATLAHELRNPLAPLGNGLELLKHADRHPGLGEKTRDIMERQLRQMVRLVDDLLDVSRISTGKLALRKENVELQAVVRDAIESTGPFIQSRSHQLEVSMPSAPICLDADRTRLAQIFSNLLNNAAKFTDPGGHIRLEVKTGAGFVTVSVIDDGIGIDSTMLDRVFELFEQADRSLEWTQAGLGVGLSLARRLTVLHGGTLDVTSAGVGQGSEFVVRLPLPAQDHASRPANLPVVQAAAGPAGHRVLVVDDNRDFADSLATLLQTLGNEVRVANDGAAGLEMAREFVPHVAFLDIGMPKLNGFDLAMRLRALPSLAHSYLVAVTGWGQDEDRRRAKEAGFDKHLVKPVEFDHIVAILRGLPPG